MAFWKRPLFWVVALIGVVLLVGYFARPEGGLTSAVVRSSFRTTPDGTAALYRAVDRMGRPADARLTPMADADPVRGTVALLAPLRFPSPREARTLLDHVRAGGTLLYAPSPVSAVAVPTTVAPTPLMDSLGLRLRKRTAGESYREQALAAPEWNGHELTEGLPQAHAPTHGFSLETLQDGGIAPLLTAVDADRCSWQVATELSLGAGRVFVFADAEPLSNAKAADDPLAALFVRAILAHTPAGDTVFFDEYHQGIATRLSNYQVTNRFLTEDGRGRMLLHLTAVCLLALACVGLRFGDPVPAVAPPDRERRSPLEHVSALADLYRKAKVDRTAALLLVGRLARETRSPIPREPQKAEELLGRLSAADEADSPLAGVRRELASAKPDLVRVADGIDLYLARRSAR